MFLGADRLSQKLAGRSLAGEGQNDSARHLPAAQELERLVREFQRLRGQRRNEAFPAAAIVEHSAKIFAGTHEPTL